MTSRQRDSSISNALDWITDLPANTVVRVKIQYRKYTNTATSAVRQRIRTIVGVVDDVVVQFQHIAEGIRTLLLRAGTHTYGVRETRIVSIKFLSQ